WLFVANVAEAVIHDLSAGNLNHHLHAMSGGLLIATLPRGPAARGLNVRGDHSDLLYQGMTRGWVAGYTLWNGLFVYSNFPAIAGHQLAVLAAALAVGLVEPQRWLQARAYTLAADLILAFTAPSFLVRRMNTYSWSSSHGTSVGSVVCLLVLTA